MRYKAVVSYDGSNYNGWQIQPNASSIQEEIIRAIKIMTKEEVMIQGSGRTDSYVHASHQVFHFDSSIDLASEIWTKALNGILPSDIYIQEVIKVADDFHARYDAQSKTYHYKINTLAYDVFSQKYVLQFNKALDLDILHEVTTLFEGTKDFTSFNATPLKVVENQVRFIEYFRIKEENGIVIFQIKGNGFLRHMVRMLVATCLAYHEDKISLSDIQEALDNPTKQSIKFNIPGNGLYLVDVEY